MSNVIAFPNRESMQDYLRRSHERAKAGLHVVQDALSFGDHWMQVVDIKTRHVVFGQVHTLEQVAADEMAEGTNREETRAILLTTRKRLDEGFMYGRAYDLHNVEGELGETHKSQVWPIDEAVFLAAHEANWRIDDCPFPAQINMQIAWMAHRAWIREKQDRGLL